MGLLRCTKCKQEKEGTSEFFPLHNKKKNGLDSWCRSCRSTYRNKINRGRFRNVISDKDLIELKTVQTKCLICNCDEKLVVDHNHVTGKVRGMLCNHCNRGLGHFRDNLDTLQKAIEYLKNTS